MKHMTWFPLKMKLLDVKFVIDDKVFTNVTRKGHLCNKKGNAVNPLPLCQDRISFVSDGLCQGSTDVL